MPELMQNPVIDKSLDDPLTPGTDQYIFKITLKTVNKKMVHLPLQKKLSASFFNWQFLGL